jgi:hypothetical protein
MPIRARLPSRADKQAEPAAAADQVDSSPAVRAILDGIRLELLRLQGALRPLLEELPTQELLRLRDQAGQGGPVTLTSSSMGEVLDEQVSLVIVQEIEAVLAKRDA